MNILVVGGGGREHAVIKKLRKNPGFRRFLHCRATAALPQTPSACPLRPRIWTELCDLPGKMVDFVVVAPDDPLVLGCVDRLNEVGIPCFGPRANAAISRAARPLPRT